MFRENCWGFGSHPAVGVAVVGLTSNVSVRLTSLREELRPWKCWPDGPNERLRSDVFGAGIELALLGAQKILRNFLLPLCRGTARHLLIAGHFFLLLKLLVNRPGNCLPCTVVYYGVFDAWCGREVHHFVFGGS